MNLPYESKFDLVSLGLMHKILVGCDNLPSTVLLHLPQAASTS